MNIQWATVIIEELVLKGVSQFFISPGSRSTPLVIAVAKNPNTECNMVYDERSAAYQAVGYASASGCPAVIIATSGTAVANYYPAVVEAFMSQTPLIVISADRPPELHQVGANQTIDQLKFFGSYVNNAFNLPCPDKKVPIAFVRSTIDQLVEHAIRPGSGPVHLNCQFRKPLEHDFEGGGESEQTARALLDTRPQIVSYKGMFRFSALELKPLLERIRRCAAGIVIVGRISRFDSPDVLKFLELLDWPIYFDVQSHLKTANRKQMISSDAVETYFLSADSQTFPETIIHIGGHWVEESLDKIIGKFKGAAYIKIKDHFRCEDPLQMVTECWEGEPAQICRELCLDLQKDYGLKPGFKAWKERLLIVENRIANTKNNLLSVEGPVSEVSSVMILAEQLKSDWGLFLTNSMPIRDINRFAIFQDEGIIVGSNRGASGIDGILSSAIGFSVGLAKPVFLVIGDVALFHDLNALYYLKQSPLPIVVLLINNKGCGIFSFLPINSQPDICQSYFNVPNNLNFLEIVRGFDLDYYCVKENVELCESIQTCTKNGKSAVIEVGSDMNANVRLHHTIKEGLLGDEHA